MQRDLVERAREGDHSAFEALAEAPLRVGRSCELKPTMPCSVGALAAYTELRGWYSGAQRVGGERFYLWAALIRGDRSVSVDFAPDAGWLVAQPAPRN